MGKALRKPRPSAPNWKYWVTDNCWSCPFTVNQKGCSSCKSNKALNANMRERRDRKEKQKLKNYQDE